MYDELSMWVDTETTGTHVWVDSILEVAVTATTMDGQVVGEPFVSLVDPAAPLGDVIQAASDVAKTTHENNGLWAELWNTPILPTVEDVDRLLMDWVHQLPAAQDAVLYWGGATVCLDKTLVSRVFPNFMGCLSHRVVDVTSIMLCLTRCGVPAAEPVRRQHRALPDVLCAIGDYQHYVNIIETMSEG